MKKTYEIHTDDVILASTQVAVGTLCHTIQQVTKNSARLPYPDAWESIQTMADKLKHDICELVELTKSSKEITLR